MLGLLKVQNMGDYSAQQLVCASDVAVRNGVWTCHCHTSLHVHRASWTYIHFDEADGVLHSCHPGRPGHKLFKRQATADSLNFQHEQLLQQQNKQDVDFTQVAPIASY